jgi:aminopeptidase N
MRLSRTALALLISSSRTTVTAFGSPTSRHSHKRSLLTFSRHLNLSPPIPSAAGSPFALANMISTRGGSSASASTSSVTTALNSAIASQETDAAPVEYFRADYQPLTNIVSKINMNFDITDGVTTVTSQMSIEPNPNGSGPADLTLDGDETCVKLLSLQMDGRDLTEAIDYELAPGKLIIKAGAFKDGAGVGLLKTVVEIVPEDNTQLSGLYKSGSMYCTQCEAMGFRRITYYPDRPDNMAIFENIRIEANKESYPALLSNGNFVESGDVDEAPGRHFAVWSDPFPKPSYLFCVVAGSLGSIKDSYTTTSGKQVHLEIFSEKDNVNKLDYAMESLKRSMKWDEDKFGLEYDLGIYNIVAVNDFNMGAMENKGLNVFNTAYVLADPATATDTDYERVEGVIGHEYFHNWTGNRVTCRDWFQLTLKEGLTVFRDQEFSGDMGSNAVKRIEDVQSLRARQFAEDAGPMSHPIRPESYISMDNFYTATVYSKGAEIIRMYNTLLTEEGFRKGMDLYFERHDGQGVTCDDFRAAMADANDVDLDQFGLWYSTNGTPSITYSSEFDAESGVYKLTLSQSSNSGQPLHIPVSAGLIDKVTGQEVVPTTVLELKEGTQTFEFAGLKNDVIPSLLRQFSAPVKMVPSSGKVDEEALAFLAARDTDGFNRWEAGQRLYTSLCFQKLDGEMSDTTLNYVYDAFERTLADSDMDYSIKAYALTLPSEGTLAEEMSGAEVDPVALHKARGAVRVAIARKFQKELLSVYNDLTEAMSADKEFKVDAESVGRRRIRNTIMIYLTTIKETPEEQKVAAELATSHYNAATGMTDKMSALNALASMDGEGANARDEALQRFYDEANGDALVLNKWFSVQALADLPDALDRVKALTKHPDFTLSNPNRCRSLISAFTMNSSSFHAEDGEGYKFIAEATAEVDKINPQMSSRMGTSLIQWKKYGEKRANLMKGELKKLSEMKLSDDLFEVVNRGLK